MMTELTREQVERLGEHLRHENLSGVAEKIMTHDAALRAKLKSAQKKATDLRAQLTAMTAERDEALKLNAAYLGAVGVS